MIWGGADVIIIEIKCTKNVMHLNHPKTIPHPDPWKNYLPQNWSLVPKVSKPLPWGLFSGSTPTRVWRQQDWAKEETGLWCSPRGSLRVVWNWMSFQSCLLLDEGAEFLCPSGWLWNGMGACLRQLSSDQSVPIGLTFEGCPAAETVVLHSWRWILGRTITASTIDIF